MTQSVVRKTYFHINSSANVSPHPRMQAGDIIEAGSDFNPFFRFYEQHQRAYAVRDDSTGRVVSLPAMSYLQKVEQGFIKSNALPTIARETANHFLMLSRELLWEAVRLAEFPGAPSRQRCIWLVESLEEIETWVKQLDLKKDACTVVRCAGTGQALTVDGKLMPTEAEPLSAWRERARAYWQGGRTAAPRLEVLFVGQIVVEEVLSL